MTFDKETLGKILKEVPAYKLITPSVLVDRLKINGSLARLALKDLLKQGKIKVVAHHHAQQIYTRAIVPEETVEAPKEEGEKGDKKTKGKKESSKKEKEAPKEAE